MDLLKKKASSEKCWTAAILKLINIKKFVFVLLNLYYKTDFTDFRLILLLSHKKFIKYAHFFAL